MFGNKYFGQTYFAGEPAQTATGTAYLTGVEAQGQVGTVTADGGVVAVTSGGGGFGWKRQQDAWIRKRGTAYIKGVVAYGRVGRVKGETWEELSEADLADLVALIEFAQEDAAMAERN